MTEAMDIRFESMPLYEEINSGQRKGKPRLKCGPRPMGDFFQMTDATQHREHGLDQHPGIPETPIPQFAIDRVAFFGLEGRSTQDNPLLCKGLAQRMASGIGGMRARTIPGYDQAEVIQQPAEFAPDNPALIRFPFAANLLPTAPLAHGLPQFNAIAIDYPQDRGQGQELVSPGPVCGQESQQACPLWQRREQFAPIPIQPAIERTIAHPFESAEEPQSDDFARPQIRQGMVGAVFHRFIYPLEQLADKVLGCHVVFSWRCVGVATRSLEPSHDVFQGPLKLAPLVTTIRMIINGWCRSPP
jgi:hypothetical protein